MFARSGGLRRRAVRGVARGSAGLVAVMVAAVMVLVAAPAVGLAGGGRVLRPGAARTVAVTRVHGGRVVSRRARLFVPVAVAAALPAGREIARLRTVTSDTFAAGHGVFSTRVYPFAVNYRDRSGRLVAIDDTLVGSGGGGYHNRANSFRVDLPGSLGSRPVRFSLGGAWLSFSLRGARGVGRVAGNRERFAGALPGVAASYTVQTSGLDEQLRVSSGAAPASFGYAISASRGLVPRALAGGVTAFDNPRGRAVFVLAPAVMWSSRSPEARVRVASSLRAVSGGWRLTLTPDRAFVARVLRSGGQVVIDPTVFPGSVGSPTSDGDCELDESGPNTADCGSTVDSLDNNGLDVDRILWRYDIADNVPRNAEVLSAELGATISANANTASEQVGVYRVTHSWTQSATWNNYDGVNGWATEGGDTASTPADTTSIAPSATTAAWHPLALVQGWVDGTIPNDGLMLEAMGPTLQSDLALYSNASANGANAPYLDIRYEPRLGDYRGYTLDSQTLTDRSGVGVNVADGNLLVANQDLHIAGTAGDDLVVGRYYNNLDAIQGAFGRGWTMTPGTDTALDIAANGLSVFYRGASGAVKAFTYSGSTWTSPSGLDAVLTQTSSTTWSVHFNQSGVTQHFTGPGGDNTAALLTSVVDRNNNTISYAYNASDQLETITDTQGRQTQVQYNAAGYVSQITDPSGRVYKYYQDPGGNLTSYVDPAEHTTSYAYDSRGDLTQITTPAGNITKFAYGGAGSGDYRVTSVTRLVKATDTTGPTRSYAYFTGGSPCSASDEGRTVETNELGYTTTYCYTPADQVDQTVDPDGHATSSSFTADGNVSQLTTALGGTAVLGYENPGTTSERLSSVQFGGTGGPQSTLVYNDPNNAYAPSQVTDPENRSVTYAYDSAGNQHTATDRLASQNEITIDHNPDGTVADSIDADGQKTSYHYTGGNLTEIDPPDLTHLRKTTISYDSLSRPVTVTDGNGQERDYTYDAFDRVTSVTYKTGGGQTAATITYGYDGDGNLLTRTEKAPGSYAYVGPVASATGASGGTTATLTVGANGVRAGDAVILAVHTSNATTAPSATDSAGNTYHVDDGPIPDTAGDATTILSAQNVKTLSGGQQITVTMPSNAEYFVDAQEFSGLTGATDGSNSAGATNSSSVSSGQLTTSTAGDLLFGAIGWESGSTPTALSGASWTANPPLSNSSDGLQDYSATASGIGSYTLTGTDTGDYPTWMAGIVAYTPAAGGAAKTTSYTYDGLDRLTAETFPDSSSHSYGYDAASNLRTITDAGGTVTYGYNKENWLTSVADPAGTTTIGYDNDGNRTSVSYPNGASIAYTYDSANTGRLTKLVDTYKTSGGGTATDSFAYTYIDGSGHDTMLRQSMTDQANNTTTYSYDPLDRLTEALTKTSGGGTLADYRYTLDGAGNLLQETSPAGTTSYAYNADNQACWSYPGTSTNACGSPPSGAHLDTYDLNGNQAANGTGLTMAYNPLDQTTQINGSSVSYDGEGQTEPTSTGTTSFQNDLLGLSQTTTSSDTINLTRDLNDQLIDQRGTSSGTYYPLTDGEGSIIALTNSSGQLANTYGYDPNGNRTASTGTAPSNWGFQGGYQTTGGLYHYAARFYNPLATTFTQQDPIDNPTSLLQGDRYPYAGDDPLNLSDETGLRAIHPMSPSPCKVIGVSTELSGAFAELGGLFLSPFVPEVGVPLMWTGAAAGAGGYALDEAHQAGLC